MKRLDRIREALTYLNSSAVETGPLPKFQPHIGRSVLAELADSLLYVCFPECCDPPLRIMPPYVERSASMEWVLTHVADILSNQIYNAFVLHGDRNAVKEGSPLRPVKTSQRSVLDWNAPETIGTPLLVKDTVGGDGQEKTNFASRDSSVLSGANSNIDVEFLRCCRSRSEAIVTHFLVERLPHVRWLLHTDVEAIFRNDVAATSPSEVILCYPGIRCMLHQRVAHQLYLLGVPTNLTRLLTEIAHGATGIDIHPNTSIGHHFFIDHGTGVVIGATAIIGNYVSVYQGVTLGAKSFPIDKKTGEVIKDLPRHPILEDHVTVYANAVVLGRVTIGTGSTIGGNCWVVHSVPPHSSIVQKANRYLQKREKMFVERDGSGI
ncbi:serine acetyltransferase [Angomonas deanei]|nr:serine acetyltransferase [Angomonas deanei]|eukprot:EPY37618.1 serine acetyltransferase [Angomonas deanei]